MQYWCDRRKKSACLPLIFQLSFFSTDFTVSTICVKKLVLKVPSRGLPELTSWGRLKMTSWGCPNLTSKGRPHLTSKGRPWEVVLECPQDVLRTSPRRP